MTEVVLVSKNDKVLGYKEKFSAHKNPVPLHRAISIVVFSPDKKSMLLQKRSVKRPTCPLFFAKAYCVNVIKRVT